MKRILQPINGQHLVTSCTCHNDNIIQSDACKGRCCTKIENLSVIGRNGYVILDNVNLHIHCGELTALVGKNGAGKSTFFKALLGEVKHSGTVTFFNETGSKLPRIGYVPQKIELAPGSPVSVADLIRAGNGKKPVWIPPSKKELEMVDSVLEKTGAAHLSQRRLSELSGGELQRVMLALALIPVPEILLLDEPVSGIDRNGLYDFYQLVSNLLKTYDMTILLISHDLDIISSHADRVVLLDKKVKATGTPESVYTSDVFVKTFGIINVAKGVGK